jgi:hypothetical protein
MVAISARSVWPISGGLLLNGSDMVLRNVTCLSYTVLEPRRLFHSYCRDCRKNLMSNMVLVFTIFSLLLHMKTHWCVRCTVTFWVIFRCKLILGTQK